MEYIRVPEMSDVEFCSVCAFHLPLSFILCTFPFPFPFPCPFPNTTIRFGAQKLLQEAATTRQSTPVQERSIAWNRLKEETDLKRIVSGARKW